MHCLLAIDITSEACRWISLNPSYVLWPGLLVLIILVFALYYAFKFKSSKAKTFIELTHEKEKMKEASSTLEKTEIKLTSAKAELKQIQQEKESLDVQIASLTD